jgi:competence protein ComEC
MDWWLASFFLGAILSLFLPIVPDLFVLFLLLIVSIIFICLKRTRLSSGLLIGVTWMLFNAFNLQHSWQNNNLDAIELSKKTQVIQGTITSLHSIKAIGSVDNAKFKKDKEIQRVRFNMDVSHVNDKKLNSDMEIRLSWNKATFAIQQGQLVQVKVKIKPSHSLANIGGFNYKTWLNSKSIIATGYVVKGSENKLIKSNITYRQQLFNHYQTLLPKAELTSVLLALAFGSRAELNSTSWQVLQATGTSHLIAISGLHIGLVATGSYVLLMLLIRLLPLNNLSYITSFQSFNIRYVAIGFSLLIALIYGYLAGFSLPTVRALVMLVIFWAARLLTINLSVKRWLLITLFVLTVTTPFSLFTASFWLSVYAVTIIFICLWRFKYFISSGNQFWRFVKGLVVIQLFLTLMMLPISAIFFQKVSLVSIIANVIAVPWMSFISIPLCLISVLLMTVSESLSQFFIILCLESVKAIWSYLTYLSNLPWALMLMSKVDIKLLIMLGIASAFYFTFVKTNKRNVLYVVCIMLVMKYLTFSQAITHKDTVEVSKKMNLPTNTIKDWQLVVFDVGQGLSILIKQNNHAILYDTGASYSSGFNMVEAVILPYLQHEAIEQLDFVIISHGDNDHAGGLKYLQQMLPIKQLIYNDKIDANNKANSSNVKCIQGESFQWQALTFAMLWPKEVQGQENDDSCVILITDGKHKVLLTGDISKKVEAQLIRDYPMLSADILMVPHHGSKTSSSYQFIQQVKPTLAIVSAGFLNRWNMPVVDVVKRYEKINSQLLNTAEVGQININITEQGISLKTYRDHFWPFWFAN